MGCAKIKIGELGLRGKLGRVWLTDGSTG